jgi:hypothetical protein
MAFLPTVGRATGTQPKCGCAKIPRRVLQGAPDGNVQRYSMNDEPGWAALAASFLLAACAGSADLRRIALHLYAHRLVALLSRPRQPVLTQVRENLCRVGELQFFVSIPVGLHESFTTAVYAG